MFKPTNTDGKMQARGFNNLRVVAEPREPKLCCVQAVDRIKHEVPDIVARFDTDGSIWELSTQGDLAPQVVFTGDPAAHALSVLALDDVTKALGLECETLGDPIVTEMPNIGGGGWRCVLQQELQVEHEDKLITVQVLNTSFAPVGVEVYIDQLGCAHNIKSSLQHGRKPTELELRVDLEDATRKAAIEHGKRIAYEQLRGELVFVPIKGRFRPMWDIVLKSEGPTKVWRYLVRATNGVLEAAQNEMHFLNPANATCVWRSPDPKVPLNQQTMPQVMDTLTDPRFFRNEQIDVLVPNGRQRKTLAANAQKQPDGSTAYDYNFPADSQNLAFQATNVGWGIISQDNVFATIGLPKPANKYTAGVGNKSVQDNAYCSKWDRSIEIGVGSGTDKGGLAVDLGNDLSVERHESGHRRGFEDTPGGDLGGDEGAAIHEGGLGDMIGAVPMDLHDLLVYGPDHGFTLTLDMMQQYNMPVGAYAMPPALRVQIGKAHYPEDMSGEPHGDGLIVGQAQGDLLKGMMVDPRLATEQLSALATYIAYYRNQSNDALSSAEGLYAQVEVVDTTQALKAEADQQINLAVRLADFTDKLEAMGDEQKRLLEGLLRYLQIAALVLKTAPTGDVTFAKWAAGWLNNGQRLFGDFYKDMIVQSFAAHGINMNGKKTDDQQQSS